MLRHRRLNGNPTPDGPPLSSLRNLLSRAPLPSSLSSSIISYDSTVDNTAIEAQNGIQVSSSHYYPSSQHVQMRRPSDTQSTVAPVSTLTTSEYWNQSNTDVLHLEIARRVAEPRTKQEIAKALSCERLEFKILWNRSLDINQLPNELLIQIFKFATAWLPNLIDVTAEGRRETPNGRFWRLMRVCRHWREVIVGTPAFWCSVLLKKATNWTELCLARSVAVPIEVIAFMPLWCRIEHLTIMYPLIHRIGNLYFGVQVGTAIGTLEPDVLATVPLLFGNGMPGLERLHFAITHDKPSPYHLPIDVELTCQRFPRLRRLALTGIVAPQDASFYTQLRTLSLTTCTHHLSFDHFLDTLASCTGLKLLHLCNTVHRLSAGDWMQRDPGPPYRRPLVSFPHLDKFMLSGHRPACTSRFLAHFHIHSSTYLAIVADAEDQQADPLPDGACSMAAMFPPSHAVTLEPLAMAEDIEMAMSSGRTVEIRTSSTLPAVFHSSLRMQLGPDDHRASPSRWGSVADLVQFLGRSPLTSLSISYVLPDAVAAWAGVFRTFPLLERLSIRGYDHMTAVGMENDFLGLHAASESTAGVDLDSDPPIVACPNLKHVSLNGSGSTALCEAIHICFRCRGERGFVLAELNLELW